MSQVRRRSWRSWCSCWSCHRRCAVAAAEEGHRAAHRRRRRDHEGVCDLRSVAQWRRRRGSLDAYILYSSPHICRARSTRTPGAPAARRAHAPRPRTRNPPRPYISFENVAGNPHLFYGVRDRADGLLLLDLLARTRTRHDRPVLRAVVSVHECRRLLPHGAAAVRRLQPALLPAQHHPHARGRAARHDHQRSARRPAQPPQSSAVAAGDVRGHLRCRHRQHARFGDRHRLPARRRARAVFEQALAHHADRHDQRAAHADRADAVALRRQLVVVPGKSFGRRVRDLRDRLLRLRQHAQVAGRGAGARRGSALARRDRRPARSAGARRSRRGAEPPHGRPHPHGERRRRPVGVGMGHHRRHHAHRREQPVPRAARRARASSRAPTTPPSTCTRTIARAGTRISGKC